MVQLARSGGCKRFAKKILNPIIDWTTDEVWEFIHEYDIPYCPLYDEGFKRLGCIGCPMAGTHREEEFNRYPTYKKAYLHAFQRMLTVRQEIQKEDPKKYKTLDWENAEEVFNWWMQK